MPVPASRTATVALLISGACSQPVASPVAAPPPVRAAEPEPGKVDPGTLDIRGAAISLDIEVGEPDVSRQDLSRWVERCAGIVGNYYGRFPVDSLDVELRPGRRGSVGFGQAFEGRRIRVHVGERTTVTDLEEDWVMIHEMIHLGFPALDDRHRWMREGLSTYLEPILRARAGQVSERAVWRRWLEKMEYGLPEEGDRGLDRTHTWANVYWGGALFWLIVDVRVREATENRRSIEHILRGITGAGGNGRVTWPMQRVGETADAHTGTAVFSQTYESVAHTPLDVDLDALWRDLGIRRVGEDIVFDEQARLARVRQGITRPHS